MASASFSLTSGEHDLLDVGAEPVAPGLAPVITGDAVDDAQTEAAEAVHAVDSLGDAALGDATLLGDGSMPGIELRRLAGGGELATGVGPIGGGHV